MLKFVPDHRVGQAALLLPAILYVSIYMFWKSNGFYIITGDEPHYLYTADSIVNDHDVLLTNNYSRDTYVSQEMGRMFIDNEYGGHIRNQFSIHGVGLPLLIAIPYGLGGVTGAKLLVAMLIGTLPFVIYWSVLPIINSEIPAVLVALTISASLPFSAASNQIFPDLLGGIIILYVVQFVVFPRKTARPFLRHCWFGLLVGFLPWLHIRLIAPSIILFVAYTIKTGRIRSDTKKAASWVVSLAIVVVAYGLLGVYNYSAYQNALGPYGEGSLTFDVQRIAMIFVGLHWDAAQGIFVQNPFMLLGLLGVIPIVRDDKWLAGFTGLLYLFILVPNSMHPNWYGGWSFVGRFGWAAVLLWVFPLAYSVRYLVQKNSIPVLVLCVCCILLQAGLASVWLVRDGFLYNSSFDFPAWSTNNLYATLMGLTIDERVNFPSFQQFDYYLIHSPNYSCMLFGLFTVVCGWFFRQRATWLPDKIWPALTFVILSLGCPLLVLLIVPPQLHSVSVAANQLPGQTGTNVGTSRIARSGDRGYIIFGPYIVLPHGSYDFALAYDTAESTSLSVAKWDIDVSQGREVLATGDLPPSNTNGGVFHYKLDVLTNQVNHAEFRVLYQGQDELSIKRLSIIPLNERR